MRSLAGCMLEAIQACALDLSDLIAHERRRSMSRYSSDNVLGGIGSPSDVRKPFKSFGSFLQLGIEAADAEPDQCCFDSVDDPTLLSDEALALAVGPFAIFVLSLIVGIARAILVPTATTGRAE